MEDYVCKEDFSRGRIKDMGALNRFMVKATHHPEAEESDNNLLKYSAMALRNVFGRYVAGNMTSDEQRLYGNVFGKNPVDLTLYNTAFNAFTMYLGTIGSHGAGLEGWRDDFVAWGIWSFCNVPKSVLAIKNNKGYQPWTVGALVQNSTTYWNWALERGRGPAEALGIVPEYNGLEDLVEKESFEMDPDYSWEEV
ncbi:MAG: hypothetical protein ABEI74_02000 [Candidatus Pacearchaeota archaeon]